MAEARYDGLKVTVMGLGLNGGGLASTRYFASRGAKVTVTDLRLEEVLEPTLTQLQGLDLRFVLGRHEEEDFRSADLVVKNPAVRPGNPFLALAKRVETDLSVFLAALAEPDRKNPVLAVTGSKGKSTTATALHALLSSQNPGARLGGNITVSPLSFLDELQPGAPVVLELSSWQLADLKGRGLLRPQVAAVTNLLWDHMNAYATQEAYADDKAVVFEGLTPQAWSLVNVDSPWGGWFSARSFGRRALLSACGRPEGIAAARFWLEPSGLEGFGEWTDANGLNRTAQLLPTQLLVPGAPFRQNCLMAAAMAVLWNIDPALVPGTLAGFGGVEHRLEKFHTWQGIDFYNDTTATIPEAAAASVAAFANVSQAGALYPSPVHWIGGGTDKNLDLSAFETMSRPASVTLLRGSATDRILPLLHARGWVCNGPFSSLEEALDALAPLAKPGSVVLLSPGAASFELFKNEFDRGNTFKALVRARLPGPTTG
ncbi:MAG: UDP-N-acetylmuramoyl-L-alanine--D-glutamate ligase [Spirochaetales bacterium]